MKLRPEDFSLILTLLIFSVMMGGVVLCLNNVYLQQLHQSQAIDFLLADSDLRTKNWSVVDGNYPVGALMPDRYFYVLVHNKTREQMCLTALHEIGHDKGFSVNDLTEEYAIDFAKKEGWRCKGL